MQVITKEELETNKDFFYSAIVDGELFIHPTDTIYGIGCNATNADSVKKVRDVKKRHKMPFSVIAPSKEWIFNNCVVEEEHKKYIDMLPGPYTLILKLENKECVAPETNNDMETLGVRIPDHWFSEVVEELGVPVVTTSANITGQDYMTSLEDLHSDIKSRMKFLIYEEEKQGKPSKIIDLTGKEEKVTER